MAITPPRYPLWPGAGDIVQLVTPRRAFVCGQ